MHLLKFCAAAVLATGLLLAPARADTAFQARAVAENVLSPHVKGKLIWIRSLIGTGVDHRRWSFLYFDPYPNENGRLVVVRDGAVVKVDQGFVELDHLRMLSYKEWTAISTKKRERRYPVSPAVGQPTQTGNKS
jgi:hypothetical protein